MKNNFFKPKWSIRTSFGNPWTWKKALVYRRSPLSWKNKYGIPRIELIPVVFIKFFDFEIYLRKGEEWEWERFIWINEYYKGNVKKAAEEWPWEIPDIKKSAQELFFTDNLNYSFTKPYNTDLKDSKFKVLHTKESTRIKIDMVFPKEQFRETIDKQLAKGKKKYGHSLAHCPLDKFNWTEMLLEELVDAMFYYIKNEINKDYKSKIKEIDELT